MKVRIVTANRLGSMTGSTTRVRMVHWEAPMLRAASTVWKSTERMALRRKIMWLDVQLNVITNSTAPYPWNHLMFMFGKILTSIWVMTPVSP